MWQQNRMGRGKEMKKRILDVACGSRMFWFNKNEPTTVYMDIRNSNEVLCDNRELHVNPDVVGDFRNIPFTDNEFHLVVFYPPHLVKVGKESWLAKKYGILSDDWEQDLRQGFSECMRVLKPNGTLIFKWNEEQITLNEILKVIQYKPLFGNRRSKTHWIVFMKEELVATDD